MSEPAGSRGRVLVIEDDDLARAVIAAEDSGFCSHWGFDIEAIRKALR